MSTPEGCNTVMPYLILKNAAGFLEFVAKVFHATEKMTHLNDDQTIMHAEVFIGESVIMVGSASDQWPTQPAGMFIYVDNADETYALALQSGATNVMEPNDQPYGRTSGVLDPYGNTWWITSVKA